MLITTFEFMSCRHIHFTTVLLAILVAAESFFVLERKTALAQDAAIVTEQEKAQVQKFSKHFVSRLLKTRDVSPLIPQFFLNDFTAFATQDFYEKVSKDLYAKLTHEERQRVFVAQENLGYIITLDVLTNPVSGNTTLPPLKRILPDTIAQKLNHSRLLEGTAEFSDREELFVELNNLEKAILEARPFLIKRNLEQSPVFLRKIRKFERDPGLGYRVRASVIDEEAEVELGLGRFAGQKLFMVDTPILMGLVLLKDGDRLRILTLVPADGD